MTAKTSLLIVGAVVCKLCGFEAKDSRWIISSTDKEVLCPRDASPLSLSSATWTIPKHFSLTYRNQLHLGTLLMRRNQRLVLLLLLTFRVLWNPSRWFWIATTLKLLKNLSRLYNIFLPNLRILSRKNNEQTLFILFRAMTVITSTSDRQKVSFVYVCKSIKKPSPFAKKKIQLCRSTHALLTVQLGGIILKLSLLIDVTSAFVWKPGISTPPTLHQIVMITAYYLAPIYTSSEERAAN